MRRMRSLLEVLSEEGAFIRNDRGSNDDRDGHGDDQKLSFIITPRTSARLHEQLEVLSTPEQQRVCMLAELLSELHRSREHGRRKAIVRWVFRMFHQLFTKDVRKLLRDNPLDKLDEDTGVPFWGTCGREKYGV